MIIDLQVAELRVKQFDRIVHGLLDENTQRVILTHQLMRRRILEIAQFRFGFIQERPEHSRVIPGRAGNQQGPPSLRLETGSKEGLFGEVVTDTMRDPIILSESNLSRADLPRAFAEALVGVTMQGQAPLDGFLILFRSTTSATAARIARERIAKVHQATATAAIAGDHASERAALFLAVVAGVQMMRQMLELEPLTKADPALLVELLVPVISSLIAPDTSCP